MVKIKYSYAVVQSIFGNLWVGKSKNKPDGKHYFKTHQEAINTAMLIFEDKHGEFDPDEECNDYELLEEYDGIQGIDGIEEIKKGMEKFVL